MKLNISSNELLTAFNLQNALYDISLKMDFVLANNADTDEMVLLLLLETQMKCRMKRFLHYIGVYTICIS